MNHKNEIKLESIESCRRAIDEYHAKHEGNTTQMPNYYFVRPDSIEQSAWTGAIRFPGQKRWINSTCVLFSDDFQSLYLSYHWGAQACGLYKKI